MATYLRIDSVLLGKMLENGREQAGIYAQSFRIVEILSNYGYLFTLLLLPLFSRMIKQNESVDHLARLSFTLLIVPALIIVFGCLNYRYEILDSLYKHHVASSANVFAILSFSFLGICITYIYGTLLTANGSLTQLNTMAGLAVFINVTLNLILIKKFGITGAAIANAATQLFTAAYQIILAKKIFQLKTDLSFLLRLVIFIILIAAGSLLISKTDVFWVYSFSFYVIVALLLSFALGLMKIKSFYGILSTE